MDIYTNSYLYELYIKEVEVIISFTNFFIDLNDLEIHYPGYHSELYSTHNSVQFELSISSYFNKVEK